MAIVMLAASQLASAGASEPPDPRVFAQSEDDPFSSLIGKRRLRTDQSHRSPVERFETQPNQRVFLFENHGQSARIKFLCRQADPRLDCSIDPEGPAEEIFLLTPARGPRGDMLFKNAAGEPVLRIAAHGGATVVWPGETRGKAASRVPSVPSDPLTLAPARRTVAHRRAQGAAAHLSAMTGAPITFDIGASRRAAMRMAEEVQTPPLATPQDNPSAAASPASAAGVDTGEGSTVLADAVVRVAEGIHLVAANAKGAKAVAAQVNAVRFVAAGPPVSLLLEDSALIVIYDPDGELAGRPSSLDVARFLEENL